MADINITFKINEYGNGVIDSIESNKTQNNISKYPYQTTMSRKEVYVTPDAKYQGFVLGTSVLGSDYVLDEPYSGFMFGAVTDNDGNCSLEVTIKGDDILTLIFTFDMFLEQYPTHYKVLDSNGIESYYTNDSANPYVLSVTKLVAGANATKKITFYKWNRPNYNVLIKDIESVEVDIELNKRFINNIELTSQATHDASQIIYGVLANTGKLELNDYNGTILSVAKLGYLDAYTYNLYTRLNGNQIQQNLSIEAPYYSQDKQMDISLSNSLTLWSNVNFNERTYPQDTSLYQVVLDAFAILGYSSEDVEKMTSTIINVKYQDALIGIVDDSEMSVKEYLQSITFDECTINKTSVSDILDAVCTVAQLLIYANDEGEIVFVNARPLASASEDTLVIEYKNQRTRLSYDMVVSNRYDNVEIS